MSNLFNHIIKAELLMSDINTDINTETRGGKIDLTCV